MIKKTDKEKIKSLENLLTKKIEDLYSLSLYDDLDPENFNDDIDKKIHSAYKKQLDRLSINLSISYFSGFCNWSKLFYNLSFFSF